MKVVSPTQRPPLPPKKYAWYSLLLETKSVQEPKRLMKKSMIVLGIETTTFRFVALFLNQMRHRVPPPPPTSLDYWDTGDIEALRMQHKQQEPPECVKDKNPFEPW